MKRYVLRGALLRGASAGVSHWLLFETSPLDATKFRTIDLLDNNYNIQ